MNQESYVVKNIRIDRQTDMRNFRFPFFGTWLRNPKTNVNFFIPALPTYMYTYNEIYNFKHKNNINVSYELTNSSSS